MKIEPSIAGAFLAAVLLAGAAPESPAQTKAEGTVLFAGSAMPWSEKVITGHVEQGEFSGRLERAELEELAAIGEKLFTGKFTRADGAGRPKATQAIFPTKRRHVPRSDFQRLSGPDASACASCHNEPVIGGAGDVTANVFVSEGFANADFDTTDPQFSNERNTNHLMGAGLVELIAREMTSELVEQRANAIRKARETAEPVTVELVTKSIGFGSITAHPDGIVDVDGLEGIDTDLNVRPFSQKGVFTSLRQFTINAMNHHHGMQAAERFGRRWTGEPDFDEDGKSDELLAGDISALVAWQASLRAPVRMKPIEPLWIEMAAKGEALFESAGCAQCHVPALPLSSTVFSDPGPFDVAGTLRASEVANAIEYDLADLDWVKALPKNAKGEVLVPVFTDFKRHKISDQRTATFGNELLAQRFVERDQFQTTELWGVGSTGPYGHRGDLTTLDEAILAHGGEAAVSAQGYRDLSDEDRQAIIAFLKTLVIR